MSRRKWRKLRRQIKGALLIAIAVLLVCILGALGNVLMMQTDTLNTLNDVNVNLERFETANEPGDQFTAEGEKIAVSQQKGLSSADREYITRVCMAEAGNDLEGNMAVATVIHDRATLWNMQPIEVVTADSQFAKPRQGELYEESVQAVWSVFDEGMRATEENITHFHAEGTSPYWAEDKQFVCSRGGNRFYR